MNGYNIFLMLELARLKGVISKTLEYDTMWGEATALREDFDNSKYNDENKSEYDAILEFLDTKPQDLIEYVDAISKEEFDAFRAVLQELDPKAYAEENEDKFVDCYTYWVRAGRSRFFDKYRENVLKLEAKK